MSVHVPTSFIQLYASEVKAAYQREGALLRQAVRVREGMGAERIYFPKLGKGMATAKGRHADVVPMNIEHDRVYADPKDFYAPEYIDELDQVKINWSLRSEYVRSSAWALGRQTDNLIIDAALGTTNEQTKSALDLAAITGISEELINNDVPLDRQRWAVISPGYLSDILNINGATSSDFTREQILNTGTAPAYWMGFNWIVHTALGDHRDDKMNGIFFHTSALGLAIARDIQTSVDWIPTKVAWLVNSWMSMDAVMIENDGIIKVKTA